MADLASLQVALELNAASFQRGVDQALQQMGRMEQRSKSVDSQLKSLGKTLVGVVSVGAVVAGFDRIVSSFDDMSKAAAKTGVAAEELQKLAYAADLAGVPFESLQTSLGKLAVGMSNMSEKSSAVGQALKQIGVDAGGTVDAALLKIANRFQSMPDGAQKTALAIELFGKAGAQMIPFLNEGEAGLKKLGDEAERLGVVLSTETLKAAEEFNDNMTRLKTQLSGIGQQIASGLLPALKDITAEMAKASVSSSGFKKIGEAVAEVIKVVTVMAGNVGYVFKQMGIEIGGIAAQMAALARLDFKGFAAIGKAMKEDAAAARIAIDKWSESIMKAGTTATQAADPVNTLAANTDNLNKAVQKSVKIKDDGYLTRLKAEEAIMLEQAEAIRKYAEEQDRANKVAAEKANQGYLQQLEAEAHKQDDLADFMDRYRASTDAAAKAQLDLIASLDPVGAAADAYIAKLQQIDKLFFDGVINGEQYARMMEHLTGTVAKSEDAMVSASSILTDNFNSFFKNLQNGTASASEAFKRMTQSILAQLLKLVAQKAILKFFGLDIGTKFAKGGAFGGATGLPYGVYDQPTFFKMPGNGPLQKFAKGGVLGEAGPEAILPLRRDAGGKLGVESSAVNVVVNNAPGYEANVSQQGDTVTIDIVRATLAREIRSGVGALTQAMQGTYGLARGAR